MRLIELMELYNKDEGGGNEDVTFSVMKDSTKTAVGFHNYKPMPGKQMDDWMNVEVISWRVLFQFGNATEIEVRIV